MLKFLNSAFARSLEIILVVAGVIVFSFFDPFNIFAAKVTLKDTPISEHSIREIGQLITAEYYGEVVSSLSEELKEEIREEASLLQISIESLHEDFSAAITEMRLEMLKQKGKTLAEYFEREYPEIVGHSSFDQYFYYLRHQAFSPGNNFPESEYGKTLGGTKKRNFYRELYEGGPRNDNNIWKVNLDNISIDGFIAAFEEDAIQDQRIDKKLKRSRLVLLGRGWVKAGFDFGTFTDRNFTYRSDRRTVHFIGLQPEIISATINPWFIPEKGVEGFEIMIADGKAKRDHELMKRVKQISLNKLRQQAIDRDILGRAQENAEVNLKSFFSLLIDDEIAGVYFHTNLIDYTLTTLLEEDSMLVDAELLVLDSTLSRVLRGDSGIPEDERLEEGLNFLTTLGEVPIQVSGATLTDSLNRYTKLLYVIGADDILSIVEQDQLRSLADGLDEYDELDVFWYPIQSENGTIDSTLIQEQLDLKEAAFRAIVQDQLPQHLRFVEETETVEGTIMIGDSLMQAVTTTVLMNPDSTAISSWLSDSLFALPSPPALSEGDSPAAEDN